jgi:hypothetical protein
VVHKVEARKEVEEDDGGEEGEGRDGEKVGEGDGQSAGEDTKSTQVPASPGPQDAHAKPQDELARKKRKKKNKNKAKKKEDKGN